GRVAESVAVTSAELSCAQAGVPAAATAEIARAMSRRERFTGAQSPYRRPGAKLYLAPRCQEASGLRLSAVLRAGLLQPRAHRFRLNGFHRPRCRRRDTKAIVE